MLPSPTLHSVIRSQLSQQGPCTLKALLDRLPQFSWSQIFTVVEELSRAGELVLRHPDQHVHGNPLITAVRLQPIKEQAE